MSVSMSCMPMFLFSCLRAKWVRLGVLELLFYIGNMAVFMMYQFKHLDYSFVVLEMIMSMVKIIAAFVFVTSYHLGISSFSLPIVTAILTHAFLLLIMVYYTLINIQQIPHIQAIIMCIKIVWFVYECLFATYLTLYWKTKRETIRMTPQRPGHHPIALTPDPLNS